MTIHAREVDLTGDVDQSDVEEGVVGDAAGE